jgi:hypothetical protein
VPDAWSLLGYQIEYATTAWCTGMFSSVAPLF